MPGKGFAMKGLLSVSGMFAAAMLIGGSAFAEGQEGGGRGRDRGRRGPSPWANAGGKDDDKHDGKHDGKDGKPGRHGFKKPPLSEVDTNGDGKVSDAEREAFKDKMRAKIQAKVQERVLEHFDDNGDGVLSGDELNKVARALMHARKAQGSHRTRPESDGERAGREGPPRWSNAGGNRDSATDRRGPPEHANAGGRPRRRRPAADDQE